jgi:hypothetical protein
MGDFKGPCDQCRIAYMASPPLAVAGREADNRHYASLLLLQAKVAEIAEKSERQMARVMVNMGSQNVQKNKPTDYQLSAAVSNRTIG